MKKAEIIKNGNVNIQTVSKGCGSYKPKTKNKEIDWEKLYSDYYDWVHDYIDNNLEVPGHIKCFAWLREQLS